MSDPINNTPRDNDPERHFRTDHLKDDLRGRSVRSGAITMGTQGFKFFLQLGSTAVMARLLTPADYGLLGMVTVVTGFISLFKDMGLSAATIQKAEITHKQVSTLFWINVAVSSAIVLLTSAIGPLLANLYNEPRLTWITLALSIGFLFRGLGVQHQALLARQMRFGALATTDIISMVLGIGSAIVGAFYGLSYWALVLLQLVTAATNTVGDWIMCGWRPGMPDPQSGVGSMLAFGRNLTGFNIINYFSRNLDNFLIGWYCGPFELGLYAKAYQLLLLPIQQINGPISSVVMPAFSRLQSEPEQYRKYYRKAVLLIVVLGMPLVAFLYAEADNLIMVFLGKQWISAVPIFKLLAPAAFLGTFNVATGWVYTSLGRSDRQLRWVFVTASTTVLSFIIGVQWCAVGVAQLYSISVVLVRLPAIIYCFKGTPLQLSDLAIPLSRPAFASIVGAAILMAIDPYLPIMPLPVTLLTTGVLYGLLYLGIWMLLPQGKSTLIDILRLTKELRAKPKGNKRATN